jgi:hypothetical protein
MCSAYNTLLYIYIYERTECIRCCVVDCGRAVDLLAHLFCGAIPKNNKKTEGQRKSQLSYELYRPRHHIYIYVCVCIYIKVKGMTPFYHPHRGCKATSQCALRENAPVYILLFLCVCRKRFKLLSRRLSGIGLTPLRCTPKLLFFGFPPPQPIPSPVSYHHHHHHPLG